MQGLPEAQEGLLEPSIGAIEGVLVNLRDDLGRGNSGLSVRFGDSRSRHIDVGLKGFEPSAINGVERV